MTPSLFQNRFSHKFETEVCGRPGRGSWTTIAGALSPREQSNDYNIIIKIFAH